MAPLDGGDGVVVSFQGRIVARNLAPGVVDSRSRLARTPEHGRCFL